MDSLQSSYVLSTTFSNNTIPPSDTPSCGGYSIAFGIIISCRLLIILLLPREGGFLTNRLSYIPTSIAQVPITRRGAGFSVISQALTMSSKQVPATSVETVPKKKGYKQMESITLTKSSVPYLLLTLRVQWSHYHQYYTHL